MPISGDVDQSYPNKLLNIGIRINEPFIGAKQHHRLKCELCSHEWVATPISKLQNYKKHGIKGCPECSNRIKYDGIRSTNIAKLTDRGLQVVSEWDGTTGAGKGSVPIDVTVKNTQCGHTFTSNSKNLLNRGVECPICAKQYKTNNINHWSELNSVRWRQTATEWQKYKSTVTKLSRQSYITNKHLINPDNLATGRAGTEGAHHIDHIVPIRYCYDHQIPEELCAHPTNLQMLGWLENVGSRDKLKPGLGIPEILQQYIQVE